MLFIFQLTIKTIALLFLIYSANAFAKNIKNEAIPLASFVFTQHDNMRVGWYKNPEKEAFVNLQPNDSEYCGSLFVQLRPRKYEGEYQLALRVLKDGARQHQLIRKFSNGQPLDHKLYLTIPFENLIGAIQGEALRSLFPNDQVEVGGWRHQMTYDWETTDLIAKSFTKTTKHFFEKEIYKKGETFLIPWNVIRTDLELRPLAVRKPLFIKKDEFGLRYAFYRIKKGETLYSSVVIRFIGEKNHYVRNQNANDLLVLNGLSDAHQLSAGQLIKIPINWIRPEYLHQVPAIYRLSKELRTEIKKGFPKNEIYNDHALPQLEKSHPLKIISKS